MDIKVACKYCGEMIDPDAGFCPICGAVNKRAFRQDPNKEYCKFCGSELSGTEEFCLVCGTPVRRVLAGTDSSKHTSIDDINPELKRKNISDVKEKQSDDSAEPFQNSQIAEQEDEPLNFLRKAAIKQEQNARAEEEEEKRRLEETKAFNEEREKLRVSATRALGSTRNAARSSRAWRSVNGNSGTHSVKPDKNPEQTKDFAGESGADDSKEDFDRLKAQADEAGVSVEEMKLFEQVKANFETDNETYPDDYNVNDYAQFDYAESRYGAFNIGSLELESIEYQNQQAEVEEPETTPKKENKESKVQGVIGVKKKKTPLGIRILVFFIAVFAVAGLAGIILYIVPMVKDVHPEEILMDESIETAELTITPISVATATPTPSNTPTPTVTPIPTPDVDAIIPQSVTPSPSAEMLTPYEDPETTEPEAIDMEPSESGFLVPDSDSRIMDPSELDGLSQFEIRLIANEIYARYGYAFRSEIYSDYFGQFDWYDPIYDPEEFPYDILSEEAQANLNMIEEYEREHDFS